MSKPVPQNGIPSRLSTPPEQSNNALSSLEQNNAFSLGEMLSSITLGNLDGLYSFADDIVINYGSRRRN